MMSGCIYSHVWWRRWIRLKLDLHPTETPIEKFNFSIRGVSRDPLRSPRLTPRIKQLGLLGFCNQSDWYTFTPPSGPFCFYP